MKRAGHLFRLALGLALIAAIVWALDSSWTELSSEVNFDWAGLPLVLLGTSVAALATAGRWKWITEQLRGNHLPFMTYFYALVMTRLIGLFTSTLAVDLVGRGVALKRGG